jgi:hypothetical protein
MRRAEKLLLLFYGTALLGTAALAARRKFPKTTSALTIITLAAAISSASAGAWISKAGGHIRHPEFRPNFAPTNQSRTDTLTTHEESKLEREKK